VDNTVQLLTGGPLDVPFGFGSQIPTDFTDAVQLADTEFASAFQIDLTGFVDALSSGDYGSAIDYITSIPDDALGYPLSELILGAAVSF
jgi:hypothetical protein